MTIKLTPTGLRAGEQYYSLELGTGEFRYLAGVLRQFGFYDRGAMAIAREIDRVIGSTHTLPKILPRSIREDMAQEIAEAIDDSCAGGGAGLDANELERVTEHVTAALLASDVIRQIRPEACDHSAK
ncbi:MULTISPECIES: hypothetical protein [Microbacterium]|uniref:hypothetical protein n=1 Tax=Microbacterium TaxID=33882 RepID=UPI0024688229|nr:MULTISPECIES: hypothetical protein [Microbacterium]MDH5134985.1 hypothetical protein [Microbacterium sp. RD10]MDH5138556.1 hypothetical protein [Microbacterium sp. RD11]MDH5146932.1 hypothetical protein [Microbacterium sp. RD12]MDH5156626.1 hypothetical protein [Microbacterium sp. RD06]MDH5168090.1 hypothetical protein [Microbacterium sp. RD02]